MKQLGFTLLELLVVMVIIGLLSAYPSSAVHATFGMPAPMKSTT